MSTAAGARLRAAKAAGVGKSLCLGYAFAGPAGDASARPHRRQGGWVLTALPYSCPKPEQEQLGVFRSPSPAAPEPAALPRCRHRVTASRRPGLRRSRCRRRCERSRDAIQGCIPLCAHRATPSPVPPTARRAVALLLPFGTPGLLFRTRGRRSSEGEAAFPACGGTESHGPGRSAPRGGGARRHREELLGGAEAVGGGRRPWVGEAIVLLSPKSKVLRAVN
jgi:hypothetical protein